MTLTFDPTYDLDLGFSKSNLKIAVFQELLGLINLNAHMTIKSVNSSMGKNEDTYAFFQHACC